MPEAVLLAWQVGSQRARGEHQGGLGAGASTSGCRDWGSREPSFTKLPGASCPLAEAFPGVSPASPRSPPQPYDGKRARHGDLHLEAEGDPGDLKALHLKVHPDGGLVVTVENILAEPVGAEEAIRGRVWRFHS